MRIFGWPAALALFIGYLTVGVAMMAFAFGSALWRGKLSPA